MSAFNITLALPQARGADATSGKPVDPDGGGEADRNRFGEMFRDIGRQTAEPNRPSATAETAASAEATATDTAAQSLADALASAGKSRSATDGRSGTAQDSETLAGDTAASLLSGQGSKSTRTATATQANATRQALAEAAARLLSAADAAKALAAQDAEDMVSAEAATAQVTTDKSAPTSPRGEAADAKDRRLQGNQALTSLLFGRTEAEDTVTAHDSSWAHTENEAADADASGPNGTASQVLPDAATAGLPQTMAMPLAALPAEAAARAAAGQSTAGRDTGAAGATTTEAATAAQPMRITILSRETHFAPIRTLALNGASAPDTASALAAAGTAPTDGESTPSFDLRNGAPDGAARQLAANASGTAATRAAITPTIVAPGTGTAASAEGEAEMNAATLITPRSANRDTGRTSEARQTARSADATAATTRGATAQATGGGDVTQERAEDVSLARAEADGAPLTGVAAIGGSSQPATPALATLRQIGTAIAAEASSMGATSSAAGPTANLIAGPVRLLDIQLSPDDLGTVNVRMRLSSTGLEIRLRASNADTARMLERDQSALLDLLAASGITADSITIVGGDGAGLTQLTGQDAGRPFASQQSAAGDAETPREQGGRDQQGRGADDDRQKGQSRDDQARSPGRAPDFGGGFRV
ncbi:flagellar hook-length control protein FliK [Azorhizobium sp. AG788]|uniref:flagellar hook-length control protein FliK n=1 Tax=Azorhizobium sp. AG788 TaxID=2183897 RepID=UPI00313996C8